MRQLRYLRPGDDGNHVILETADGSEQFVLYVTVPLRDAVRVDLPRLSTGPRVEPEEGIGPREIQVRVRAGADPEALAEAHGMTLERVLRFAAPVLEERVRVADTARRGRARRTTGDGPATVLGETVDSAFATNGIDPFTVRWDAHRRIDGQWVVIATWDHDEQEHRAEWAFNLAARNATPIDDNATVLLGDGPLHPVVMPEPEPEPAVEPSPGGGVVAFPRLAPAPPMDVEIAVDDVFDQDALDALDAQDELDAIAGGDSRDALEALERRDAAPSPVASQLTEPADPPDFAAQHLPLRLAEAPDAPETPAGTQPGKAQPAQTRPVEQPAAEVERTNTSPLPRLRNLGVAARDEDKAAPRPKNPQRPKVPAWDDIVLGVRRPTE